MSTEATGGTGSTGGTRSTGGTGSTGGVLKLRPAIQHYAWGSTGALPELLGRPTDGQPWAEAWYGAHPAAPSTLDDGTPLTHELPFLVKIIAAGQPLSLQTHPDDTQARAGWDREQQAGLPVDAPNRNYRDPRGKPEAVLALTDFDALCGWRDQDNLARWLHALGVSPLLDRLAPLLQAPAAEVGQQRRSVVRDLLTLPDADRRTLTDAVAVALDGVTDAAWALDVELVRQLCEHYPDDAGVLVALLLQPLRLGPGESVFVAPGCPHCYVGGVAVEVMASSDNVLRGGLTGKHIDVPELVATLDGAAEVRRVVGFAVPASVGFAPTVLEIDSDAVLAAVDGPSLVLVLEGQLTVAGMAGEPGAGSPADEVRLARAEAALVPPRTGPVVLRGSGRVLRVVTS